MQIAVPEFRIREPVTEGKKRLLAFRVEPFVSEACAFVVIGNEARPLLITRSPIPGRISIGAVRRHAENVLMRQVALRFRKGDWQLAGRSHVSKDEIRDGLPAANPGRSE